MSELALDIIYMRYCDYGYWIYSEQYEEGDLVYEKVNEDIEYKNDCCEYNKPSEVIWLQCGEDEWGDLPVEITWCNDRINDTDVAYRRKG